MAVERVKMLVRLTFISVYLYNNGALIGGNKAAFYKIILIC